MVKLILIGTGAGLAAALLFAALASGTPFAFPLFALSPLPIGLVALGWGSPAGLAALVVATLVAGALTLPAVGASFLALLGLPALLAAWLAGLAQPKAAGTALVWYPPGRILAITAVTVAAALVAVGVALGFDADQLAARGVEAIEGWAKENPGAAPVTERADLERFVRLNVALMPYTASALLTGILVFDTWAAARIATSSGRFARPWMPLWSAAPPAWLAFAFAAGVAGAVFGGSLAPAFGALVGATGMALVLSGLATLHALTVGRNLRVPLLVTTYVLILAFGLPLLILLGLGIADAVLRLRDRTSGRTTT